MIYIVDNEFTGNLRGINGAIVYLERTPYFELSRNTFHSSLTIYVARLVSSLSDFVSRVSGLKGVTAVGEFGKLSESSVRMLPLIYSNLGLSFEIHNNSANSSSLSAGHHHGGSGCASTLEFSLLSAQTPTIESFNISEPTTTNL